jgi:hypothetical protein
MLDRSIIDGSLANATYGAVVQPSAEHSFFFCVLFVFALASAKTGCPLGDKKIGSTSLPQATNRIRAMTA